MDDLLRSLRRALAAAPGLAALVAAVLLAWSLAGITLALRRRAAAWRLRRRAGRARAGEVEAASLLEAHGFRVVGAQVARTLRVEVDGLPLTYVVKADYLVEDAAGAWFVAEVKTGDLATDPLHAPTRRQLLEYQVGYADALGLLLVDMDRALVRRVRFDAAPGGVARRDPCADDPARRTG